MLRRSSINQQVLVLKDGTETLYFRPMGRNGQVFFQRHTITIRSGKTLVLQFSMARGSQLAV